MLGRRRQSDFNAEVEAHLELEAERLRAEGATEAEARSAAERAFGNVVKAEERFYEARHWMAAENLWRDLKLAAHMLRRTPSFTVAAVATLALAIAANAVVFALIDGFVLHPLQLPHEGNLYSLEWQSDHYGADSYPNFIDLRDRNRSFESLAAYGIDETTMTSGGEATRLWLYTVSGNYFATLGVQPYLGRLIQASDEHGPNSAPEVVLAYGYWNSEFHGDRGVIGRTLELDQHVYTIVGVAPPGFYGTLKFFEPKLYIPLVDLQQITGNSLAVRSGTAGVFEMLGHLRAGVTPAAATADVNAIAASLAASYPKADAQLRYALGRPALAGGFIGDPARAFLGALMLLAGLILLAACANLGSLVAARARERAREIGVRLALGAGRWRLVRQLGVEAMLVALAGGAAGVGLSVWILGGVSRWQPFPEYPIHLAVEPGAAVYGFALGLAVGSGLIFGTIPVRQIIRAATWQAVKAGAAVERRRSWGVRAVLLTAQIAICAVLVTSSLVAVRGLVRALETNLGFEPEHALLLDTFVGLAGYQGAEVAPMQRRMLAGARAIPGVEAAGLVANQPPLEMGTWDSHYIYRVGTADRRSANAALEALSYAVSPGYLEAAGTNLLAGRRFTDSDDANAPKVALVNRYFARKIFGSTEGALGGEFELSDGVPVRIVGVVENGKYEPNLSKPQEGAVFTPLRQSKTTDAWMIVRSARPAAELTAALRTMLHGLDPALPVFTETWRENMNGAFFAPRMASAALGVLGLMGAVLSLVGIFGMAAYAVSRRRRELGIRMALGAGRREVLESALGPALRLLLIGSIAGLVLGLAASRVLAAIVYEASARDPLVLGGAVGAMAAIGVIATWVPARRALGIDPAGLLREE